MPYRKQLSKDKVLRSLIKEHGDFIIAPRKNVLLELCASIIGQQLSTRVADVIGQRFLCLFPGKKPTAKSIAALSTETLRSIGLSNAKASYVKNACDFFIAHKLTDATLQQMSDEALKDLLIKIKGIGPWTIEMTLMFTMGREDVFSTGDLGLQKAMIQLYGITYADRRELIEKMTSISERWKPYRSYACRYLWKHLDSK